MKKTLITSLATLLIATLANSASAAIAIDAVASGNRSLWDTAVTSSAFATSAANELLLAFVSSDDVSGGIHVNTVTGAGLTWELVKRTNVQMGTAEIWRAFATTALSNVNVTATLSEGVTSASLTLVSFTGVDTSGTNGSGAIGATASANSASGAPAATLITTRNNSWVFGVGTDWDTATVRTLGANQTMVHQYLSNNGDTYWVQRMTTTTPTTGTSATINDTTPTADRYNLSLCEILGPNDSTPPSVTITAPSNGAALSGTNVTVSATATDNVGVAGVQFRVDGANLGAETATPPYTITWDTMTAANGTHTVTAIARDVADNTTTATPVTVSVTNASVVTLDASAIGDQATASTTVSTTTFSTTAGHELLLAFIAADDTAPGNSVLSVSGCGLTWEPVVRTNAQRGTAEIWRAFAPTVLTNVSVTATLAQSVASSLTVVSFSGVDPSGTNGSGAIGVTASASGASGAPAATLTTTRVNSRVFGVGNDYDHAIARTLGPGQALVHQYLAPVGDTYWVQRTTTAVAAAGTTVTINDTAPAGDQYNLSLVEILADTTPPSVTITSPANGATVAGTIAVSATVGDNGEVVGVQFKLDGADVGHEILQSPYTIAWDTTTAASGTHFLTAVARDLARNTTTGTNVTVRTGVSAFARGDVFASIGFGFVIEYGTDGSVRQALDTGVNDQQTAGSAFDGEGNFYVTNWLGGQVFKFNTNGVLQGNFPTGGDGPESIVFDLAGNMYVGHGLGPNNQVRKFTAAGSVLGTLSPAVEGRGTNWVELASDQRTLFYTSESHAVKRFDIATNTQLPDFAYLGATGTAFALRLLPDGGLIVADELDIKRLDSHGVIVQTYDVAAPAHDTWLTINLDPDGTSFWASDVVTGLIEKFDLASGARLRTIDTGFPNTLSGVAVANEPRAGTRAFARSDIFASIDAGLVNVYGSDGTYRRTLDTGINDQTTAGSAFDAAGNFYVADFGGGHVFKFGTNGVLQGSFITGGDGVESIVFDRAGNMYVGHANGPNNQVRKFTSSGTLLQTFAAAPEDRGTDWVELATDQRTLFYTSEGQLIKRFDVLANTQLADFANLGGGQAYALRILPDGGLLVANAADIKRLDNTGVVTQQYDVPGHDHWFSLALDPDGTSFWGADAGAGTIHKFDIASGAHLQTIDTGFVNSLFNIAIANEPRAGTSCETAVSSFYMQFGSGGGSQPITVTEPSGCASSLSASDEWLTLNAVQGTGTWTATVTAGPNTNSYPRVATLVVGSLQVVIEQSGAIDPATLFSGQGTVLRCTEDCQPPPSPPPPAGIPIVNRQCGSDDCDGDGLSDAMEDSLALRWFPNVYSITPDCGLLITRDGRTANTRQPVIFRARYMAHDGTVDPNHIAIFYELLYRLDCGPPGDIFQNTPVATLVNALSAHRGDNEPFVVFLARAADGSWDTPASCDGIAAVAHANTVAEKSSSSLHLNPLNDKPDLWVGFQKHGNFVDLAQCNPDSVNLCARPFGFRYPYELFNVGERLAPFIDDLGAIVPIWHGESVWLCRHFFGAGIITDDLYLAPFQFRPPGQTWDDGDVVPNTNHVISRNQCGK